MPTNLDELLNEAFKRRRQKCCYETTYSHDIVKEWLESAIAITAEDWKVIVPIFNSTEQSSSPSAVLQWPNRAEFSKDYKSLFVEGCNVLRRIRGKDQEVIPDKVARTAYRNYISDCWFILGKYK